MPANDPVLHPHLLLPKTDPRRIALEQIIIDGRIKAYNENQALHRDPVTGGIHVDHPSSTGLYRLNDPLAFMAVSS